MSDPTFVFEFPKNQREIVRASHQRFMGRDVVDIRAYYPRSSDGVLCPSPKGLTIDRSLLPELEQAVHALREADALVVASAGEPDGR